MMIQFRVLLTGVSGTLFKDSIKRNYFIKKLNISILNALITNIFMQSYYLKVLKSALGTLVNISLQINESGIQSVCSLWVVLAVVEILLLLLSRGYGSLYDFILLLQLLQLKMHHCDNVQIDVFSSFVGHHEITYEFMFDECVWVSFIEAPRWMPNTLQVSTI